MAIAAEFLLAIIVCFHCKHMSYRLKNLAENINKHTLNDTRTQFIFRTTKIPHLRHEPRAALNAERYVLLLPDNKYEEDIYVYMQQTPFSCALARLFFQCGIWVHNNSL